MKEIKNDTDRNFCATLLDVMEAKGVRDVVCSPGSRNTPLLLGVAARPGFRRHVVVDERSAAFMALGMAVVSREPVGLVCTSGTALLNYAPAVAEAFYQGIPLIVLSADRPQQWIDQDDSQTLRQFEALGNFVKKSYQLPAYGNEDPELNWYALRTANDAMSEALSGRPGPVHVNVQLGEPLNGRILRKCQTPRIVEVLQTDSFSNPEIIKELAREAAGRRVMLVAGFLQPDSKLNAAVSRFASLPNVVVMAETLSNLHAGNMSHSVDSVLTAYPEETLDEQAPDIVVSIGGSLVSRKLKEYLRRNARAIRHWALGKSHTTVDCFMSLTKRIEGNPARVLGKLTAEMQKYIRIDYEGVSDYAARWEELRREAAWAKEEFLDKAGWSELEAYHYIFNSLPRSYNLFLSNGTAVRYAQLFPASVHASYCNRGVSGIDGSASTAFGAAKVYGSGTVLVTGDMSMAYDVGSLALPEIPETAKVIVIDNAGGGIFRFISSTSGLPEREELFCAKPRLPLRELAVGYGWHYSEANDRASLLRELRTLFRREGKAILKVTCPPQESAATLKEYMNSRI